MGPAGGGRRAEGLADSGRPGLNGGDLLRPEESWAEQERGTEDQVEA